jgi:hypothetical protein
VMGLDAAVLVMMAGVTIVWLWLFPASGKP